MGHTDNPSTEPRRTFPRGTYYEIIGNLKTLGNITLDCQTIIKDWEPVSIDADFSHTTLWVDKTKASITSNTEDMITYKSNAYHVDFGCETKVNGEDLVVLAEQDEANGTISFKVNPKIPISAFGEGQYPAHGNAKIWLQANNLKKYLDVEYDVAPYFEVDPVEVVIYWGEDNNTKVFDWETNLGGLVLPTSDHQIGKSIISVAYANGYGESNAIGQFTVTATTDPVTTTVHTFAVCSKDSYGGVYRKQNIKVTVRPPVKDYRIYFRAINDRAWDRKLDGNRHEVLFNMPILSESTGTGENDNNWNDGWLAPCHYAEDWSNGNYFGTWPDKWNSDGNKPSAKNHNIWLYTQKGETEGGIIPESNVWHFKNGDWDKGLAMTADNNNTGWYYYDLPENEEGYQVDEKTKEKLPSSTIKYPKPGETLMMFYSNQYSNTHLHRCPHHLAPGITLFNYEDKEGWVLYDPTSEPYYRVYDEKPIVEDVNYTIYTRYTIDYWYIKYGVAANGTSGDKLILGTFTVYDRNYDTNHTRSLTCENVGNGWHRTTVKLKATVGNHEKGIVLCSDQAGHQGEANGIMLFGGRNYERYQDTGYYEGGSWHPGKPSGV